MVIRSLSILLRMACFTTSKACGDSGKLLIKSNKETILIDTSPDLRFQLLKNKVSRINRVLYSHQHADQTHGINDLRVFYLQNKKLTSIKKINHRLHSIFPSWLLSVTTSKFVLLPRHALSQPLIIYS